MMRQIMLFLAAMASPTCGFAEDFSSPPNVILIITDDQGYGDLGVTGNPIVQTPNMDRMAAQGAWMSEFYVSPVCAPTRASLMTGRYNYRTRVVDTWLGRAMMDPEEITLAELLRDAGYRTGIFGKWHLGDCYPLRPMDQGFQQSLVHRGGGISQPSDPQQGEGKYTDPVLLHNGTLQQMTGYCTDVYFEHAIRFIQSANQDGQPFFVYLADNCPHGPFHDVPPADLAHYRREQLGNEQFPQQPGHPLTGQANLDRRARTFAMITNTDRQLGRLMEMLRREQLYDNTVVIFLTDNGPDEHRYVGGFRGSKSSVYEGGIRVPFFVQWPARIAAGTRCNTVAAHIDVMPTILDICNVEVPAAVRLDGRSILPWLLGNRPEWPDRTIFIQSHRGDKPSKYHHFAARSQQWKLVHASGFARETFQGQLNLELYDMSADPLETNNVAALNPQVVAAMTAEYERWFADVSTTREDNFAPPRIQLGSPHENPVVLTRQDWRRESGPGWDKQSQGRWLTHVTRPGFYTCRVTLRAGWISGPYRGELQLGSISESAALDPGVTSIGFGPFALGEGPVDVRFLAQGDSGEQYGPWQMEIQRLDDRQER